MEQAIELLRAMPESKQDQLARFLLAELEEDEKWSGSTAEHEGKLKGFVEKMLADDAGVLRNRWIRIGFEFTCPFDFPKGFRSLAGRNLGSRSRGLSTVPS